MTGSRARQNTLRKLGGDVQVDDDRITISPRPLHGGTIDPGNDHRTAMSFAGTGAWHRESYHHRCRMREQILPRVLGYTCRGYAMKRIVLVGFRGTGKTEIGKRIALHRNVPFIDTDTLIEQRTGRSIPDIFHDDGEKRFRDIEHEVIASLPLSDVVISTGGGVVADPVNMEHLRADSTCILLTANLETIEQRLTKKPRPPLTGLPLHEEIAEMIDRRRQQYHAAADFCIDTSETSPDDAAQQVIMLLDNGISADEQRKMACAFFKTGRIPAPALEELENILTGTHRDPQTRILGVAGYPCAHSRSPHLFNALFSRTISTITIPGLRTRNLWRL